MVNIDKIKIVLFDFDDTLYLHSWHGDSEEDKKAYNEGILKQGKEWFNGKGTKSWHMEQFIKLISQKPVHMGLISATNTAAKMNAKHSWVLEQYGTWMGNYCVAHSDEKVLTMEALANVNEVDRGSILIVDDYWLVLEQAANAGFMAASPMEVAEFIYRLAVMALDF